jgi:hypothetical protein
VVPTGWFAALLELQVLGNRYYNADTRVYLKTDFMLSRFSS